MIETKTRARLLILDIDPHEAFKPFLVVDPDELDDNKILKKKPPPKRWLGVDKKSKPKPN